MDKKPPSYYEYQVKYSYARARHQKLLNKWIDIWNKIFKQPKEKE